MARLTLLIFKRDRSHYHQNEMASLKHLDEAGGTEYLLNDSLFGKRILGNLVVSVLTTHWARKEKSRESRRHSFSSQSLRTGLPDEFKGDGSTLNIICEENQV